MLTSYRSTLTFFQRITESTCPFIDRHDNIIDGTGESLEEKKGTSFIRVLYHCYICLGNTQSRKNPVWLSPISGPFSIRLIDSLLVTALI